jgi:hypothetical protein
MILDKSMIIFIVTGNNNMRHSSVLMVRVVLLHVGECHKANFFECVKVWVIFNLAEMRSNTTETKQSNEATHVKYL